MPATCHFCPPPTPLVRGMSDRYCSSESFLEEAWCREKPTLDSSARQTQSGRKECFRHLERAQSQALKDLDPLARKENPSDIQDVLLGLGLSTAVSLRQGTAPWRRSLPQLLHPSLNTAWPGQPDRGKHLLPWHPGLVLKGPTTLPHTRAGKTIDPQSGA